MNDPGVKTSNENYFSEHYCSDHPGEAAAEIQTLRNLLSSALSRRHSHETSEWQCAHCGCTNAATTVLTVTHCGNVSESDSTLRKPENDAPTATRRTSAHIHTQTFVERERMMGDKTRGIYQKYNVTRTDGSSEPGGKHDGCFYFVLDCTHDPHALKALQAYMESCRLDYPFLARDLECVLDECQIRQENTASEDESHG